MGSSPGIWVMAFLSTFGIPQAHENDAQRGVRADWQPLLQSMASKLAQCSVKG